MPSLYPLMVVNQHFTDCFMPSENNEAPERAQHPYHECVVLIDICQEFIAQSSDGDREKLNQYVRDSWIS